MSKIKFIISISFQVFWLLLLLFVGVGYCGYWTYGALLKIISGDFFGSGLLWNNYVSIIENILMIVLSIGFPFLFLLSLVGVCYFTKSLYDDIKEFQQNPKSE